MSFVYRATMTTPNDPTDEDLIFEAGPSDLPDKEALNRLELALARLPLALCELTSTELRTKRKPFADGGKRELVIYQADVEEVETGADYGGHTFRFPNQAPMAREYLRSMLEGAFAQAGFKGKGRRVRRGKRA